jgi:hypothetical protein
LYAGLFFTTYSKGYEIKEDEMCRASIVDRGDTINMHKVLVIKPEVKRSVEEHMRRYEGNINMELRLA